MQFRRMIQPLFMTLPLIFALSALVHAQDYCISIGSAGAPTVDYHLTLDPNDSSVTANADDGAHTYTAAGYFHFPYVHLNIYTIYLSGSGGNMANCHEWDIRTMTGKGMTYSNTGRINKWTYSLFLCDPESASERSSYPDDFNYSLGIYE